MPVDRVWVIILKNIDYEKDIFITVCFGALVGVVAYFLLCP